MDNIFLQISTLLGLTVTIALFIRMLKQPLMVAYLVAGIVAGPVFLNILHGDNEVFGILSKFGVVLLLFVVGLSLNFDHIKRIGKGSLIGGLAQVFFTSIIGYGILQLLGFEPTSSLYLAIGITFSSTIVIVKLLTDKRDMQTTYGRYVIGLMIVQDIVAILIMLVVTTLSEGSLTPLGSGIDFVGKTLALVGLVYFLSRFLLPKIIDRIATSTEFLFIFTIAWCFGIASALNFLGFSIEIGAIIAGLTLGSSPYQTEIASRVKPLRDFFIVLFFIILGTEMGIANVREALVPAIILSLFILIGNPVVLYASFRVLKFTRRNSFLIGLTAAQVSEFGFILLYTGLTLGHITGKELEIFTIVGLITIVVSTYMITYSEQLYRFLLPLFEKFGPDKQYQREENLPTYDVWVVGYHRVGAKIVGALMDKGASVAVIDYNPRVISKLKRRGIPAFFGDIADVEFLESVPLTKAKLIVSTINTVDDQRTLIDFIRKESKNIKIVLHLFEQEQLGSLYKAGADYVMMPHQLSGNWIAGVLEEKPWTKKTFEQLRDEQKKDIKRIERYENV